LTPREAGFLLLTCRLGDPQREVLTTGQLRTLASRVGGQEFPGGDREVCEQDLVCLGYGREMSRRIVRLLDDGALLEAYLKQGRALGCVPVTRASAAYPPVLRRRLGLDSPGCLWAKGDMRILNTPAVSLVGSRELREENRDFAREVGYQAAIQGLTLVSGNARGADRTAQEACLKAGGRVISIVADELSRQSRRRNVLFLSEDGFDEPFSAQRALSRNRCIHALGRLVLVAQSDLGRGGTWDGTAKNLRYGWSPVACFRDGSESARRLEQMGACLVGQQALRDFGALARRESNFLEDGPKTLSEESRHTDAQ